jgi:hypothetical protein
MPRELVEAAVIPEQSLGPIRHMLMSKWPGTDSMQHGAAQLAVDFKVQLHGSSITISLEVVFPGFFSKNSGTFQVRPRAGDRFQVAIDLVWFKRCHDVVLRSILRFQRGSYLKCPFELQAPS